MKTAHYLGTLGLVTSLSGCGFFESDDKQQLEQAWLAKDQQLAEVIEQIRTQGVDAVAASAQVGSVSALCSAAVKR
ncbi:hypothetical protein Sps_04534 [Shewanella psychrophila]|uniref:Lipoprotein n=1 Tax=Shewanella psychrophila TaxID=225848 RepID=A0A1S6HVU4_9GAMM|nr:hypothetical protein Sps_04534 [Shewanella psychrophila]